MSQFNESNVKTFTNDSSAIGRYLRVKLSSGVLALAGASDTELGVTRSRIEASVPGGVHVRTAQGTVPMVAAGAISAGAEVFAAASGKIASSGSVSIGTTLEASTADGDIIEILRN